MHLSDRMLLKSLLKEVALEVLEEIQNNDSSTSEKLDTSFTTIEDKFLTREDVSQMLNVSMQTLNNWQKKQILIPLKIGKRVLYKPEDVEKALQKQESNSKNPII
ncbi:helix-turn-helix domain-containing protein [Epilithonimonas pallida]